MAVNEKRLISAAYMEELETSPRLKDDAVFQKELHDNFRAAEPGELYLMICNDLQEMLDRACERNPAEPLALDIEQIIQNASEDVEDDQPKKLIVPPMTPELEAYFNQVVIGWEQKKAEMAAAASAPKAPSPGKKAPTPFD